MIKSILVVLILIALIISVKLSHDNNNNKPNNGNDHVDDPVDDPEKSPLNFVKYGSGNHETVDLNLNSIIKLEKGQKLVIQNQGVNKTITKITINFEIPPFQLSTWIYTASIKDDIKMHAQEQVYTVFHRGTHTIGTNLVKNGDQRFVIDYTYPFKGEFAIECTIVDLEVA